MTAASQDAKAEIERAEKATKKVVDKAADKASQAVDKAANAGADASSRLENAASAAREKAGEAVDGVREALSDTSDRLKETLRRATDRNDIKAMQDQITAAVSGGVTAAVDALRDSRVSDVAYDLRDAARRNPAPFILGAAVAGFVVGRFILSSQERQRSRRDRH